MRHSYDLVLLPLTVGEPIAWPSVFDAFRALGAQLDETGRGTWRPRGAGEQVLTGEIELAPVLENGAVAGVDTRIPFRDDTALLEHAVKVLLELAEAQHLRVTDPQRADTVSLTSLGAVIEAYLRGGRYAGEYGGVGDALGLSTWAQRPEDDGRSNTWLLAVVVFALSLYGAWKIVTSVREARLRDALEQGAGPDEPRPLEVRSPSPGP